MAESGAVLLKRFTGSGDAQAFAEITRRHAGLVYGAALRILADVDRASDVAQETFLQLAKDAGHVTGSLPGWLHRVATHKAIDQRRQETSRHHRERQYAAVDRQATELTEWKDVSPQVDVALRELDSELRDVLILHFLEGRTTREIAAALNLSQATISRRIGSGVEQLRAKLRRRGILVAVGALSALLGDNAVQAAPLPLLAELGKMAIVGGTAAGITGVGVGSGFYTIAAAALSAVQTKVVAVAAIVVIGAGVAVTYHQMTKSSSEPALSTTGARAGRGGAGSFPDLQGRPTSSGTLPQPKTQSDSPIAAQNSASPLASETLVVPPPIADPVRDGRESVPSGVGGYAGMMGGTGGMAMARSPEAPQDTQKPPTGPAGGSCYDARLGDRSDPNRPADPNFRDPNGPGKP